MVTIRDYRIAAYFIILLGCAAAAMASLVPFYTVGYKVDAIALAAVLTPFVIYGMFSESLRGPWLLASGLVLLGATLAVVVDERFLRYDGYRDATLYWVPLLAVALVLPIAYGFGKRPPYT
ncbi:MAG: hypothetical protein KKE84_07805 [Gammaproteobacteria bacterium]|nr:hypothetical protein [Gammaproteobacteria bacterium]